MFAGHGDVDRGRGFLELRLPASLANRLEVDRLKTAGPDAGAVESRYRVLAGATEPATLVALGPSAPLSEPRGAGDIFRALFARPFGPRALAAYLEERSREPEPVYGISREEAERMGLLLAQLADTERQRRHVRVTTAFTVGAAGAVYFGLAARGQSLTRDEKVGFGVMAGLLPAVALGVVGRHELTKESDGEKLAHRFRAAMATPGADQGRIAAETEGSLQRILDDERRARTTKLVLGWVMTGLGTAGLVANEANEDVSHDARIIGRGYAVVFTSAFLAMTLSEQFSTSPTEKLIALWMKGPDRARTPSLSLAPIPGGGMVALTGRF